MNSLLRNQESQEWTYWVAWNNQGKVMASPIALSAPIASEAAVISVAKILADFNNLSVQDVTVTTWTELSRPLLADGPAGGGVTFCPTCNSSVTVAADGSLKPTH